MTYQTEEFDGFGFHWKKTEDKNVLPLPYFITNEIFILIKRDQEENPPFALMRDHSGKEHKIRNCGLLELNESEQESHKSYLELSLKMLGESK